MTPAPTLTYRIRSPITIWIFAVLVLAGWVGLTFVALHEPRTTSPPGIFQATLAGTGALVLVLLWKAVTSPCITLVIRDQRLALTLLYPVRILRYDYGPEAIRVLDLIEVDPTDSDGYYATILEIGAVPRFEVEHSPDRADAVKALADIRHALGLAASV